MNTQIQKYQEYINKKLLEFYRFLRMEEQIDLALKVNYDFINEVQNEIEGWL